MKIQTKIKCPNCQAKFDVAGFVEPMINLVNQKLNEARAEIKAINKENEDNYK